mmetsp:Transcript_6585/g.26862  ORF Transcript_6585/g.26862 Transcript_6585/m.26862 type:complete len:285 (+) Transcript_6585:163-1017(+)
MAETFSPRDAAWAEAACSSASTENLASVSSLMSAARDSASCFDLASAASEAASSALVLVSVAVACLSSDSTLASLSSSSERRALASASCSLLAATLPSSVAHWPCEAASSLWTPAFSVCSAETISACFSASADILELYFCRSTLYACSLSCASACSLMRSSHSAFAALRLLRSSSRLLTEALCVASASVLSCASLESLRLSAQAACSFPSTAAFALVRFARSPSSLLCRSLRASRSTACFSSSSTSMALRRSRSPLNPEVWSSMTEHAARRRLMYELICSHLPL